MTHLSGHDRSQLLLLPEAVDDYVGPDNPVRFIDAFVDGLDLAAASFIHVEPKATVSVGRKSAAHSASTTVVGSLRPQSRCVSLRLLPHSGVIAARPFSAVHRGLLASRRDP